MSTSISPLLFHSKLSFSINLFHHRLPHSSTGLTSRIWLILFLHASHVVDKAGYSSSEAKQLLMLLQITHLCRYENVVLM